jgi:transcriptional regulator with XRE-family HTH domain|nr:MAG TPA: helix-turn-helix domain protein [Caudoviricetes sp.]
MTQGERVRRVRKELRLTLEKFGEKVGVGKTAISNIEKGNRNLTEQMAKSICREFSVDYTWLTTGEGDDIFEKSPSSTMEQLKKEFDLDDFSYNLVYQYLKLNADQRQAVRDFFYSAAAPEPNIADQFPNTAAELEAQYGPSEAVDKNEKEVG